jgi:hypothetical protein
MHEVFQMQIQLVFYSLCSMNFEILILQISETNYKWKKINNSTSLKGFVRNSRATLLENQFAFSLN